MIKWTGVGTVTIFSKIIIISKVIKIKVLDDNVNAQIL